MFTKNNLYIKPTKLKIFYYTKSNIDKDLVLCQFATGSKMRYEKQLNAEDKYIITNKSNRQIRNLAFADCGIIVVLCW